VGVLLHVATPADQVLQFGVPAFGLGVILVAVFQATHRFTLQRWTLRLTAVAFAVTAAGQFDWAWIYGDSGYLVLAIASGCTAAGAAVNAVGFARVRFAVGAESGG
jgi:O-antigen/teichoic acid export membrane protein